jgi:hypothetical protein
VILYPREKDGGLKPRDGRVEMPKTSLTRKEAFWLNQKRRGYVDWKIEEMWGRLMRIEAQRTAQNRGPRR